MTDAKTIFDMIETVDPADTAKLDEIDALTWCYLKQRQYRSHKRTDTYGLRVYSNIGNLIDYPPKYTRSRDALKAVRPEGWCLCIDDIAEEGWFCYLEKYENGFKVFHTLQVKEELPTEELSELHAIIQAIDYERSKQ